MPVHHIDPDYLQMLILKVRAVMGREPGDEEGSNPIDEDIGGALLAGPEDLSLQEVVAEIDGLSTTEQCELIALMWLGRGDADTDEWDELVAQAAERQAASATRYLLSQPLLADYWEEGSEKLGMHGGAGAVEPTW